MILTSILGKNVGVKNVNLDIDIDGKIDIDSKSGINIGQFYLSDINISANIFDISTENQLDIISKNIINLNSTEEINIGFTSGNIINIGNVGSAMQWLILKIFHL